LTFCNCRRKFNKLKNKLKKWFFWIFNTINKWCRP
jgi:hypothetical protein